MVRTLVIAYGNPLRCDDGLAWRLVEDLLNRDIPSNEEVITCHQLTPELACSVSGASLVLFIDAAREGVPGDLVCTPIQPKGHVSAFSHEFSPATVLNLAQELYANCPAAFAISLCGECFDHGQTLSPKVTENLARMAALVHELSNPRLIDDK